MEYAFWACLFSEEFFHILKEDACIHLDNNAVISASSVTASDKGFFVIDLYSNKSKYGGL